MGMSRTSNLGIYLGLLIHHARLQWKMCGYLVDKVKRKLTCWKVKKILQGAKTLLIQSVTSTILSYVMQTSLIPTGILAKMKRVNQAFLWGTSEGGRFCCPVSWSRVYSLKDCGGMGLRNLVSMNLVALSKLCQRLLCNPGALWAQILIAKYDQLTDQPQWRVSHACSHTWKSILQGFVFMQKGLSSLEV